jgi:hypothetical protein
MPRASTWATLRSVVPLEDIVLAARFLRQLPDFLRRPLTLEEARAILSRRLAHREADFLALVRAGVYAVRDHPYHQLLRLAGCEYGDLERLVGQDGLETALARLYRHGVYLTVDELKGRRPAVRGHGVVQVDPRRLRTPWLTTHYEGTTSGSRGGRTPVPVDLAFIRERAVNATLAWSPRGIHHWRNALWEIPGGAAISHVLRLAAMGIVPERWFSQVDPAVAGLHPRYRWSSRALRVGSRLAGVPLPAPRYVPLDDPLPIARWMARALRAGHTPHLETFPSSAVRVCQSALAAGVELAGARFSVIGEPFTPARQAVIRSAGAEAVSRYGTTECPGIGWGCLAPIVPDDHHQSPDLWALTQPGPDGATRELPAGALLVSSLRRESPLILINASMGDQADLVRHDCGCPLERHGWTTHLRNLRSFEKLTAGGVTFFDGDVVRVLEATLPRRFGGGPTDYQLVEQEDPGGRPAVRLLVHPRIGPLDPDTVADALLTAIGSGSGVERAMVEQWRQVGLLRVERRPPYHTAGGKILHVHQTTAPPE